MTGEPQHLPARPSWRCEVPSCGEPWPCLPARSLIADAILLRLTDRAGQTVYLSKQMIHAVAELDGAELPDPHGRFLGWLPHARLGVDDAGRGS